MIKSITKFAIVLMVFVQCSSSVVNTARHPKYDPFLILEEEISASNLNNAHEFIYFARPVWLRGTVFNSINYSTVSYPDVYVNGIKYGYMTSLKSISIVNISEMKFLRAIDTAARLGTDHSGGAILISLR